MTIPEFGSLSPSDYRELGLMAGLEVHQQLLTQKKLFCSCPAGHYSEEYDAEILRHMRPTLSELGEYDGTALMEFKTKKEIIYRLNRETVCTYEMDDAPPFGLNDEALDHAIEIALLLQTSIVGELHVTRKQYLDGSIPTGFQRTCIVGTDGHIQVNGKRIGILQLGLEEDACREVSDLGHVRTYLTDRLSMPLIEAVTAPELFTPQEVADACQVLRELTRSSGRVRTGHGRGRQDVNVSVTGGTRVEIKGVPRIPLIPALVHYEALRQKALIDLREKLLARGLEVDGFKTRCFDVTRTARKCSYPPIQTAVEAGHRIRAIVVPGFQDSLSTPTQPGRAFAAEISDRIRVVACIDAKPNLIYRAMLTPNLDPSLWKRIERKTKASSNDALVLIWGDPKDLKIAAQEVEIRCREALIGVPSETRQMLGDGLAGITGFERILPGPDRMYPDTDLPPVALERSRVARARDHIDSPPWVLMEQYLSRGLPHELASRLVVCERRRLIESIWNESPGASAQQIARLAMDRWVALRRQGVPLEKLGAPRLKEAIELVIDGKLLDDVYNLFLAWLCEHPSKACAQAIEALDLTPIAPNALSVLVERTIEQCQEKGPRAPEPRWRFLMGEVMHQVRGRAHGANVAEILSTKLR